jgi:hypothetical protein
MYSRRNVLSSVSSESCAGGVVIFRFESGQVLDDAPLWWYHRPHAHLEVDLSTTTTTATS